MNSAKVFVVSMTLVEHLCVKHEQRGAKLYLRTIRRHAKLGLLNSGNLTQRALNSALSTCHIDVIDDRGRSARRGNNQSGH
jgi:hypothetical protein